MYDALLYNIQMADSGSTILERLKLQPNRYFLATVHRAENTDHRDRLTNILDAFAELATGEQQVVFPVHPRTRKQLATFHRNGSPNLIMIEPVSYFDMLALEKNARVIMTDSGGIQKEAYLLGVPCVTLRSETEWLETVEEGWNAVVNAERLLIVERALSVQPPRTERKLFGNGHASDQILRILNETFKG